MATTTVDNRKVEVTFHTIEAELAKQTGPITAFVPKNNKEIMQRAKTEGVVDSGAFEDCNIFDGNDTKVVDEQKQIRQEAKRAYEVLNIIQQGGEVEFEPHEELEFELLQLFVDQSLTRATLVEAARKYSLESKAGTLTPERKNLYLGQLDIAQKELFPSPDERTAHYALAVILKNNEASVISKDLGQYGFLDFDPSSYLSGSLLSEEKARQWHGYLHKEFDPLYDAMKLSWGNKMLEGEALKEATVEFMHRHGLPIKSELQDGWTVRYDEQARGFRVDPNPREVVVGARDRALTYDEFFELMMHEIVIHATRAQNGHSTGYGALRSGLPGYVEPEEGLGIVIQRLWAGDSLDDLALDHFRYAVLCYSDGVYDSEKHTEQETLDFAIDIMERSGYKDFADGTLSIPNEAAMCTMRAFRGMPPERRMMSNLSYLAGKVEIAGLLEQSDKSPAEQLWKLQRGKTNPLDPKHEELMERIAARAA
jgi:hypothetical protein